MFTSFFIFLFLISSTLFFDSLMLSLRRECTSTKSSKRSELQLTTFKVFKVAMLFTNHKKMKRQLLVKSCVQIIIRFAHNEIFNYSNSKFATFIRILSQRCSSMFLKLISTLTNTNINHFQDDQQYIEDYTHLRSLVLTKMLVRVILQAKLLQKMSDVESINLFFTILKDAIINYEHIIYSLEFKLIY